MVTNLVNMKHLAGLLVILLGVLTDSTSAVEEVKRKVRQPNIVMMVADDLG